MTKLFAAPPILEETHGFDLGISTSLPVTCHWKRGQIKPASVVSIGRLGIARRIIGRTPARSRSQLLILFGALLTSCAAPNSYLGIRLEGGEADPALQRLAQSALQGDKYAQLQLGAVFEEGRGVPRDLRHARKLYSAAARDDGGTLWIYSPSPGGGAPARVLPVDRRIVPGLDEAKRRLRAISNESR